MAARLGFSLANDTLPGQRALTLGDNGALLFGLFLALKADDHPETFYRPP